MTFQYGFFDPSFIGIQINKYLEFEQIFIEARKNNLSEYDLFAKTFKENKQKAVDLILYYYAELHEKKHFYDFFISYFGNKIFRMKFLNAINSAFFLSRINNVCLPIPILKWNELEESERQSLKIKIEKLTNQKILDFENDPYLKTLFYEISSAQKRIDEIFEHDRISFSKGIFSVIDILEANALIIQFEKLCEVDEKLCKLFIENICERQISGFRAYTFLIDTFPQLPTRYLFSFFNATLTWCLVGNIMDSMENLPTNRFLRAYKFIKSNRIDFKTITPVDLFYLLEKNLNNIKAEPFFEKNIKLFEAFKENINKTNASLIESTNEDGKKIYFSSIENTLKAYEKLLFRIRNIFLTVPESYLHCSSFIASTNIWNDPPTMIRSFDWGLNIESETDHVYPFDYQIVNEKKVCFRWLNKFSINQLFENPMDIRIMYEVINEYEQLFKYDSNVDFINKTFIKRRLDEQNITLYHLQ